MRISVPRQTEFRVRIVHVTDRFLPRVGGIELHVADVAARQAAAGDEVVVLTSEQPSSGADRLTGVTVRTRGSARTLEAEACDVVHVHVSLWSPFAYEALRDCVRMGIPVVVTVHSLWGRYRPVLHLADLLVGWSTWPVAWTAVSEVAAAPLRHVARGRIEVAVVPNGIDVDGWQLEPAQRDEYEIVVVAVTRLAVRKRGLALLRALRRARRLLPSDVRIRAVIVGDGSQRWILRGWNRLLGSDAWIELPGRLGHDEIRELFRRADVFVAAARLESFGIAALEARCAALPVVAFAGNGIESFVRHGRDGLLATSDRDLARAIARLAAQPDRRLDLATRARESVARFAWDVVLAQTSGEYERARRLASTTGVSTTGAGDRAGEAVVWPEPDRAMM